MSQPARESLRTALEQLDAGQQASAPALVDLVLRAAATAGVSDVHFQPSADGLRIAWRRQGLLEPIGTFGDVLAPRVVARLKVLAGLLTYEQHLPQEGRIKDSVDGVQMRVSTFPTIYGERVVVRLFAARSELLYIRELGFPTELADQLLATLHERSGLVLISGPAGSGKTTTAYALMRELARYHDGRVSLMSIEDPVESQLPGVAQSQVHPASGFTLETGLRSLLRQDPEIVLAGEIRDPESATLVFRAALTGHLVITTFHAGSCAEALRRLIDMGIPAYMLKSGLCSAINQVLLRELCDNCAAWEEKPAVIGGRAIPRHRVPRGCDACDHTGYGKRFPLGELLPSSVLRNPSVDLAQADVASLTEFAVEQGMVSRWARAWRAVESGRTSLAEVRRVMGWTDTPSFAGGT